MYSRCLTYLPINNRYKAYSYFTLIPIIYLTIHLKKIDSFLCTYYISYRITIMRIRDTKIRSNRDKTRLVLLILPLNRTLSNFYIFSQHLYGFLITVEYLYRCNQNKMFKYHAIFEE